MHLLITRPEPQARHLAEMLERDGHRCTISPLLKVSFPETPDVNLDGIQGVIITSRNTLRGLETHSDRREIHKCPLFVVGEKTAEQAQETGFSRVSAIALNAKSLAEEIARQTNPDNGPFLYLTGTHLAFDMQDCLGDQRFEVRRAILYDTEPVKNFTESAKDGLISGNIDAVILLSPRTASTFSALIRENDLTSAQMELVHFCLSENVAKNLENVPTQNICVAKAPDIASMVERINEYKA